VRACYAALRMQESLKRYRDDTATTVYREMDMRFWLEKAEAELETLGR
jgi:hypothetical protein